MTKRQIQDRTPYRSKATNICCYKNVLQNELLLGLAFINEISRL